LETVVWGERGFFWLKNLLIYNQNRKIAE